MNIVKPALVGALGAAMSILALWIVHIKLESFSLPVRLAAVVVSGVAIGMGLGFSFDRRWHKAISRGAFIGIFIVWLPVLVVTYGFALIALPLLLAYAWLVQEFARLGARFRIWFIHLRLSDIRCRRHGT